MNSPTRPYRMDKRAAAAEQTAERILSAAAALFWDEPGDPPTLDAVAERAGVTVQTVIRRFGDKDSLMAAAARHESQRIRNQRDGAPVGDTAGAVKVLVDHYEELGTKVLRLVERESTSPRVKELVDEGRAVHRAWCERAFEPALSGRRGVDRDRLLAQLVAVCDVQVWALLRQASNLSRRQTERALVELIEPLLEATP